MRFLTPLPEVAETAQFSCDDWHENRVTDAVLVRLGVLNPCAQACLAVVANVVRVVLDHVLFTLVGMWPKVMVVAPERRYHSIVTGLLCHCFLLTYLRHLNSSVCRTVKLDLTALKTGLIYYLSPAPVRIGLSMLVSLYRTHALAQSVRT